MNTQNTQNNNTPKAGKYLSFELDSQIFAIPLEDIREINALSTITPIPKTPKFIEGVINLRGKVIPVWNLRTKLGMPQTQFNKETCVIITEINDKLTGMIVDKVKDVIELNADQISSRPEIGNNIDTRFVMGVAKIDDKVAVLMNTKIVLSHQEAETLTQIHTLNDVSDNLNKALGS